MSVPIDGQYKVHNKKTGHCRNTKMWAYSLYTLLLLTRRTECQDLNHKNIKRTVKQFKNQMCSILLVVQSDFENQFHIKRPIYSQYPEGDLLDRKLCDWWRLCMVHWSMMGKRVPKQNGKTFSDVHNLKKHPYQVIHNSCLVTEHSSNRKCYLRQSSRFLPTTLPTNLIQLDIILWIKSSHWK